MSGRQPRAGAEYAGSPPWPPGRKGAGRESPPRPRKEESRPSGHPKSRTRVHGAWAKETKAKKSVEPEAGRQPREVPHTCLSSPIGINVPCLPHTPPVCHVTREKHVNGQLCGRKIQEEGFQAWDRPPGFPHRWEPAGPLPCRIAVTLGPESLVLSPFVYFLPPLSLSQIILFCLLLTSPPNCQPIA